MLVLSFILLLAFIVFCCFISYRIGYSRGLEDGRYDMDIKISAAMRQIRKELMQ
jgi:hypothetical protein